VSRLALVLAGMLLAAGCRESPPPPPPKAGVTEHDPLIAARQAMARGAHGEAVEWLGKALDRRPHDPEIHYRLAVATSHLDRLDEAEGHFEWVAAHGTAGSPEVRIARDWLAARTTPAVATGLPSAPAVARPPERPDLASVEGQARGANTPLARLQLILEGLPGSAVRDESHVLRTDSEGRFHFANVVPGEYRLTTARRAPVRWRLRVPLVRGERLVLDLSPSNQLTVRDDFPDAQP
jgi:hypothetical protein